MSIGGGKKLCAKRLTFKLQHSEGKVTCSLQFGSVFIQQDLQMGAMWWCYHKSVDSENSLQTGVAPTLYNTNMKVSISYQQIKEIHFFLTVGNLKMKKKYTW